MSEPLIFVDPANPTPPYEQVRRQLLDLVQAGTLRTGDRLPSLRQLAGDLGLAVGTVARERSTKRCDRYVPTATTTTASTASAAPGPRPAMLCM